MIRVLITSDGNYDLQGTDIQAVVEETLKKKGVGGEVELGVRIVGEEEMRQLHKQWMEGLGYEEELHDVLSFPLEQKEMDVDGVRRLGDLVVCFPVAVSQAKENKKSLKEEIEFLVEHGCLHLLGIHHE